MPEHLSNKMIFLAVAHTESAPLSELVDEVRAIEAILRPLHERGIWTLEEAFHTALAYIESQSGSENQELIPDTQPARGIAKEKANRPAWNLHLNPNLSETVQQEMLQWRLNPVTTLPAQILKGVHSHPNQSLLDLCNLTREQIHIQDALRPLEAGGKIRHLLCTDTEYLLSWPRLSLSMIKSDAIRHSLLRKPGPRR